MNNKFLSLLGICRRAGKLSAGYDACVDSIKNKSAALVCICDDISEKSQKNIIFEADMVGTKYQKISYTQEDISKATGKSAKIIAITDKGLALKALSLLSPETTTND